MHQRLSLDVLTSVEMTVTASQQTFMSKLRTERQTKCGSIKRYGMMLSITNIQSECYTCAVQTQKHSGSGLTCWCYSSPLLLQLLLKAAPHTSRAMPTNQYNNTMQHVLYAKRLPHHQQTACYVA
jgi:hypothetical protein